MLSLEHIDELAQHVKTHKFVNVASDCFNLKGNFDDFYQLTQTWESMPADPHFGQNSAGARYRRYSDFEYDPRDGSLRQLEHRAYFQSERNNRYVGGVQRHFGAFGYEVLKSSILRSLINTDFDIYKGTLDSSLHDQIWQCQIHQIRIEIKPGQEIEITPEGIHCDGYPFSGVHFWGKRNVDGAQSRLYLSPEQQVACTTYESILDTTYFLDREMLHYVSPARTADITQPAYRQIIAISFAIPGTEYDIAR